jgi:hypothetical protein
METKWESIKGQEITIGAFIIVKYLNWNANRHHSLGKVIQANKNSFTIQEIGISKKDMSESEILHRFPTFNSKKRRQITKDGEYISPSREVLGIFRIDPTILKFIGEKSISEENKRITSTKNTLTTIKRNKKATKARMKSLGL